MAVYPFRSLRQLAGLITLGLAGWAGSVAPIEGQTINWGNPSGGWWDVSSNWTGGVTPTAASIARFGIAGTYNVNWDGFTGNTTTAGLQVGAGTVTFRSSGAIRLHTVTGNTLVETSAVLNLGDSALTRFNLTTGSLTLQSGGILNARFASIVNSGGNLNVGLAGSSSALAITGGSAVVVNNSSSVFIGGGAGASGTVTVNGASSILNASGGEVWVGDNGNGTLLVEAGGLLSSQRGYVSMGNSSTSVATVTGANSRWNNSLELTVGNNGNGTMNVLDGGLVTNTTGYVGRNAGSVGSATVSGTGSRWVNSAGLFLGAQNATTNGGTGSLAVTSGGRLQVGNDTFDSGPGAELVIGDNVAANGTLVLRNGSSLSNAGSSWLGATSGRTGSAIVSGATWISSTGLYLGAQNATTDGGVGTLNLSGGLVRVGNDTGFGSGMVISDTVAANGTLVVRNGSTITNNGSAILGGSAGRTGSALVTGAGSQWSNLDLFAGYSGNGSLNVENGGVVSSQSSYLGLNNGSTGTVTITGAGSQWNNTNSSFIGQAGTGSLSVQSGGTAVIGTAFLGFSGGSTGLVNVTGTGSRLITTGDFNGAGLHVGWSGTGTLNLTSGGRVQVGNDTFSSGTASQLVLGDTVQPRGRMFVRAGSLVANDGSSYIGATADRFGLADVSGTNARWTSATGLFVGAQSASVDGGAGTLAIASGGRVQVGSDAFDSGPNAELVIGDSLAANGSMTIRNGSQASVNGNSFLGGSSGNTGTALVAGTNSVWGTSGNLHVGYSGTGILNVESGGRVTSGTGWIGFNSGSSGTVNVSGSNARWNNNSGLFLGAQSASVDGGAGTLAIASGGRVQVGNDSFDSGATSELVIGGGTLTVRNGASITNDGNSYIGPAVAGTATITGTNSTWTTANGLFVGAQSASVTGASGTLNVTAGARVQVGNDTFDSGSSAEMVIGDSVSGKGVLVVRSGTVSNAGSSWLGATSGRTGSAIVSGATWISSTGLYLGAQNATTDGGVGTLNLSGGLVRVGNDTGFGSGMVISDTVAANGTLVVRNGSTITNSGSAILGGSAGRTGSALVTGAGSQWSNSDLFAGYSGNGSLNVENGGVVSSQSSYLGMNPGSTGTVTITGAGSQWNNTNSSSIGQAGTGSLSVQSGGTAVIGTAFLGFSGGSTGLVNVTGTGSRLITTGDFNGAGLHVGYSGTGTLNLTSGGRVQVGNDTFSSGTASQLVLGDTVQPRGRMFVWTGSLVANDGSSYIGATAGRFGMAQVFGTNARWTSATGLFVGAQDAATNGGNGQLLVHSGGRVQVGNDAFDSGTTAELVIGDSLAANGSMTIRNGSLASVNGNSFLGGSSGNTGTALVAGTNSVWETTGNLHVGYSGTGILNVESGGWVTSGTGWIGFNSGSSGTVNVSGSNSRWNNNNGLFLGAQSASVDGGAGTLAIASGGRVQVGNDSFDNGASSELVIGHISNAPSGTMEMRNGAILQNDGSAHIGASAGSQGAAIVSGSGTQWANTGELYVGRTGTGNLLVANAAVVTNSNGFLASHGGSGSATVTGAGSRWSNAGNLSIGAAGFGNLNINNSGLVTVGGTTTIGSDDNVTLSGGRFEFGTTNLASFARIGGSSGELAGLVTNTAFTNLSSLTVLQGSTLDISEVNLLNSATIVGTGTLMTGFTNTTTGRLDASGSSIMRFEGDHNINHGRINSTGGLISMAGNLTNSASGQISNLGGQLVTEGQLTNQGFISGRGEFTALGGIQNSGSMAFSGTTDVIGDVNNLAGSLIVTSANATTTFYDNVVNNGEIRTSGEGNSVFFEAVSGSGSYTGTGNVFFEGNVNPGNSPAVVGFGGNLSLGSGSHTVFELGGTGLGDYDRFQIAGNLDILGSMSVELWNGFQLGSGMSFLIGDILGGRTGFFTGLGEGALVGNFSGHDLFITYGGGNGNDIALFTAIPEPGSLLLCLTAGTALTFRRRRREHRARLFFASSLAGRLRRREG